MVDRRGQSVLEYAMLLGVVVAVIVAGQIYFKRSLQGRWKDASDQIGEQFTTAETYTIQTEQQSARKEETGTAALISPPQATGGGTTPPSAWSQSRVLGVGDNEVPAGFDPTAVGGIEPQYLGHEITRRDYVPQGSLTTAPTRAVGTHGTFDSGRLSTKSVFGDD
ncbi:MAG: hypothetical protein HYW10_02845 [Candidatus Omnitrophica bacterium]|nr:hypothetical protein [Candidatus Omnitrophota bacterium]